MTATQRKEYSTALQSMNTDKKTQLFHEAEQAAESSEGAFTSSDYAYSQLFNNKQSAFFIAE